MLGSLNCYSSNSYSHFDDPFFDVGYMREVKKTHKERSRTGNC